MNAVDCARTQPTRPSPQRLIVEVTSDEGTACVCSFFVHEFVHCAVYAYVMCRFLFVLAVVCLRARSRRARLSPSLWRPLPTKLPSAFVSLCVCMIIKAYAWEGNNAHD